MDNEQATRRAPEIELTGECAMGTIGFEAYIAQANVYYPAITASALKAPRAPKSIEN